MTPKKRLLLSLLLLVPLVVTTIALTAVVKFRGALSVDNRTYVEMATGVRAHGLPYTRNSYSEDFPEARPPFNVPHDGKLWGNYPPLHAYVGAVALAIGGLAAIAKQNVVLIGLLGLIVFRLGWRFTRDPIQGVAAAYLTVFATPVWASSVETLSLPLVYVCVGLGALAALASIDEARKRTFAFAALAGLFGGLSTAAHLLAFPMACALVASLAIPYGETAGPCPAPRWMRALFEPKAIARALCAAFGLGVVLLPMALLNKERFGSYNPISYGPCTWEAQCKITENALSAGGLLAFAAPAIPYFVVVAAALFVARRRPWAVVLVLVVAAIALYPTTKMSTAAVAMIKMVVGYVVDAGRADLSPLKRAPDGLGSVREAQAIKALLQSSPFLAAAFTIPWLDRGRGARALVIVVPVLGLFASMMLLARFPGGYGFGNPHVFFRYIIPAAPLLAVLAVAALAELEWNRWHAYLAVLATAVGLAYFAPDPSDLPLLRRVLIFRVTLVLAAAAIALVVARRRLARPWLVRAAPVTAALVVAISLAISLGVDTRILATNAAQAEARVAAFEKLVPDRFALVGYGPVTDPILTLRAEREIHYIDLIEAPGGKWDNFRILIDLWTDDGLPIFGAFPNDIKPRFRWPYADWDVPAELLDDENEFWKIGPPANRLTPEQIRLRREMMRKAWEERRARGEQL